jgi:hypothetical protein
MAARVTMHVRCPWCNVQSRRRVSPTLPTELKCRGCGGRYAWRVIGISGHGTRVFDFSRPWGHETCRITEPDR